MNSVGETEIMTNEKVECVEKTVENDSDWTVICRKRKIKVGHMTAGSRRKWPGRNDREGVKREEKLGKVSVMKKVRATRKEELSRLWCEIESALDNSDNEKFFKYKVLANTGCDISIMGLTMVQKYNMVIYRDTNVERITNAIGEVMRVEGEGLVRIRPREVDGRANKNGKFVTIRAVVTVDRGTTSSSHCAT